MTNGRTDGRTDGRMDGRTDGRMEGRTDGRTDGWMGIFTIYEESAKNDGTSIKQTKITAISLVVIELMIAIVGKKSVNSL